MGPMLIFDKSLIDMISVDESVWLEQFFLINITPIFFIETIADLEKEPKVGKNVRTSEQIVAELAIKTPVNGTFPNEYHRTLLIADLLGNSVEMKGRAFIKWGIPKISPEGKIGFHFEELPEQKMLSRWTDNQFTEGDRRIAREWRAALLSTNFDYEIGLVKNILPKGKKLTTLEDIKTFVDDFLNGKGEEIIYLSFEILDIPEKLRGSIVSRWQKEGRTSIKDFAPYASFVFSIDLFLYLSMYFNIIPREKITNKVDISYLYYLPFCNIFVSNDTKTHEKVAPLFMTNRQLYIKGEELKKGLRELNDYYSKLPEETKAQGAMKFAPYPPRDVDTFITRLWDKVFSKWRKDAEEKDKGVDLPPDKELLEKLKHLEDKAIPYSPISPTNSDDADFVVIKRKVRVKRGSWNILPEGIGDKK